MIWRLAGFCACSELVAGVVAMSVVPDACAAGGEGAAGCSKGVVFDEPVGVVGCGWVVLAFAGPPSFARRFARI